MDKSPAVFLQHIQNAIEKIEEYSANLSYEEFSDDEKTQDAVIRQLMIIGEATAKLEAQFKNDHPEIPWRDISDFRNILAHEYWDIDLEIVWKAVKEDLVMLKQALISITQVEK